MAEWTAEVAADLGPEYRVPAACRRSMAGDQLGLMRQLGFAQFQLVGHDRGARVSHRLTLDHPEAVTKLAVQDLLVGSKQ